MTPTAPHSSGFGHDSTATEVLQGIDLHGRFAVVTGGSSGLGLEMTRSLAAAGADVLVPARRPQAARAALGDLASVAPLDLTDLPAVRRFAQDLLDRGRGIDILINGAGIMTAPRTIVGPGWEAHLAVHHLAPYLLTNQLLPVISAGARVVGLSSSAHFLSDIRWDDPHFRRTTDYDQWTAYGQSKTAVALFALGLDARLTERGAHAFAVHPGSILTPLQREIPTAEQHRLGWIDDHGRPPAGFKSVEQGAATAVWAATAALLEEHGGAYCQDCDVARPATTDDMLVGGAKPWVIDRDAAERLWDLTTRAVTGLT
ncbi:SDR family NAD(P)-dependent oxidoreductase [Promicromonospora vindobonensis]|uniref:SDR family NAD(P)-dependent oxidoreductase n=1 Tax=Promicromonospora vindobonensis TaxID=195748 RepID=A0ABW5W023_9MICO